MRRLALLSVVLAVAACSSFSGSPAATTPSSDGGADASEGPDGGATSSDGATPDAAPSCSDPVCPDNLASFQAYADGDTHLVLGVAADATHVAWLYWSDANTGQLDVFPRSPAGQPAQAISHLVFGVEPLSITASTDTIFASGGGGLNAIVQQIPSSGSVVPMLDGTKTQHRYPHALAPAVSSLYILDNSDGDQGGVLTLPDNATTSDAPTQITALPDPQWSALSDILVIQSTVFLRSGSDIFVTGQGGNPPVSWCGGACGSAIPSFTTDGGTLYWIDGTTIYQCEFAAGCSARAPIATAASIPERPVELQWDGARLIIKTAPGGKDNTAKIYACAPGQCAVDQTPLARAPGFSGRMFAAPDALFWIVDDGLAPGADPNIHAFRVQSLAK